MRGEVSSPRASLPAAALHRGLHFSPDALRVLLSYDWPGNVRDLENALEFAATVSGGQTLQPEDLPPEVLAGPVRGAEGGEARAPARDGGAPDDGEREALRAALQAHDWHRGDTARALGVSRNTLWRRMRELGIVRRRAR